MVAARSSAFVTLTLPKFNLKSTVPAVQTLKALGVTTPFNDTLAEFPKLVSSASADVYITDVLHQATVAIDEIGTEASAATAVVVGNKSSAPNPVELDVDRPFLFAIRDNPTGSPLFVGQVVAP
jgi:serpin B